MHLRPPQAELVGRIYESWERKNKVVCAVAPTGFGKTVMFSNILSREAGASAAIAHRRELVSQMSVTLGRNGVRHRVVGSKSLIKDIVAIQMRKLKRSFVDPSARCGVVGIDSLLNLNPSDPWLSQVRTWIGDEGHHFLKENKWGRGIELFNPQARGLLVTATAFRADGKGLGRHVDGIADDIVLGPKLRWVIDNGYLTDYRVVAPPLVDDLDFSDVTVTASGDLSPEKNRRAMHRSKKIVGNVVEMNLKFAAKLRTVVFAVDVEEAVKIANAFKAAGQTAEVVSAETPDVLRFDIMQRFERGEIRILVNVDLFGEGFDLPAVQCVQMVRKTESKPLFDQQFGRMLRLMISDILMGAWDTYTVAQRKQFIAESEKPVGLLIDHVGNVERHLPPDGPRIQTLERMDRKARATPSDAIPLKKCLNPDCFTEYEAWRDECPECHTKPEVHPAQRKGPEMVDGDLYELSPEVLARMRGEEVDLTVFAPVIPAGVSHMVAQSIKNRFLETQQAQRRLRDTVALWAGGEKHFGKTDKEILKTFYFRFGMDVSSAKALGRPDAQALEERIVARMAVDGIVKAE